MHTEVQYRSRLAAERDQHRADHRDGKDIQAPIQDGCPGLCRRAGHAGKRSVHNNREEPEDCDHQTLEKAVRRFATKPHESPGRVGSEPLG